jgi:hypothetical protein
VERGATASDARVDVVDHVGVLLGDDVALDRHLLAELDADLEVLRQDPEGADRLGLRHGLVGLVDGLLDLGRRSGSSTRSATDLPVLPLASAQTSKASGSMVISAAMNGWSSPTTIDWLTSAWARIRSSSTAGATFLPPAVTMISFLRPVIAGSPRRRASRGRRCGTSRRRS